MDIFFTEFLLQPRPKDGVDVSRRAVLWGTSVFHFSDRRDKKVTFEQQAQRESEQLFLISILRTYKVLHRCTTRIYGIFFCCPSFHFYAFLFRFVTFIKDCTALCVCASGSKSTSVLEFNLSAGLLYPCEVIEKFNF